MDEKKQRIFTRISNKQTVKLYDDADTSPMPTQQIIEYNASYDNTGLVLPKPSKTSNITNKGKNNKAVYVTADGTKHLLKKIPKGRILFNGNNNYVEIHEPFDDTQLDIRVTHNVKIKIMGSKRKRNITILKLSSPDKPNNKNNVVIGENLSCPYGLKINLARGNGDVIIGDNCMFSTDLLIRTGDGHSIFDTETGKLINPNKSIFIGNNVWCGVYVRIFKGAKISDNSIVGACSVVTKEFNETNIIVAGNPAQIVRRNIKWDRNPPIVFEDDE